MKHGKMYLAAAVFAAGSAVSAIAAEPVFYEEFDSYGYHVPNFNENVWISEYPASLKSLSLHPKDGKAVTAFKTPLALPANKLGNNMLFEFQFKFNGSEIAQQRATVILGMKSKNDPKGKIQNLHVNLNANICGITGPVRADAMDRLEYKYRNTPLPPFMPHQWNNARVIISGGYAIIEVQRDGWVREYVKAIPADLQLATINFNSSNAVSFDCLKVSPIAPITKNNTLKWENTADTKQYQFEVSNVGNPGRIQLNFSDGGEKPISYTIDGNMPEAYTTPAVKEGKVVSQRTVVPDAAMSIRGPEKFSIRYNLFPKLEWRFESQQKREVAARFKDKAECHGGTHVYRFKVQKEQSGKYQLWLDDNFLTHLPLKDNKLVSMNVIATPDARIVTKKSENTAAGNTLEITAAQDKKPFDLSVCREYLGSFYLECDGYLARTPFENGPDDFLFKIPNAPWQTVTMICSVPTLKDNEFSTDVTARLTSFVDNGGQTPAAFAEQTVTLPRSAKDPVPANVTRLKDGKYLVKMQLPLGKIQDVLYMENWKSLDFEVLGGLYDKDNYYISKQSKPSLKRSAVLVHKITLEKAPAGVIVVSGNDGNVFYPDEDASVTAQVMANKDGDFDLVWTVKDVYGKVVETATGSVKLKNGEAKDVKKSFKARMPGHYDYVLTLSEKGSKDPFYEFKGSYSCLVKNTRKWGLESPYMFWNFGGAHGTPRDKQVILNFMKRAGIHKVTGGWKSEADVGGDHPVTIAQFRSLHAKGKTLEDRLADLDRQVKELTKNFPHTKAAIIFHESGGGPLPMEIFGGKTEITEAVKKADKARAAHAKVIAQAWRKNAPHIKLVIGNSGLSLGLIAQLFREKFPADLIDYMGEESVGMTQPPERSVAYPSYMLRKLALHYGYDKVMPEACFEWKSRIVRNSGERQGAGALVRDVLIAYAWGYKNLPTVGLTEMANSYYNTIWGDGAFTRYPLYQPYPSFTATAVMTQVLDCVKFIRMIPTGTPTVYALEFKRGNEFVYTLWTARGELPVKVTFDKGAKVKQIALYGAESNVSSDSVTVSEEPIYLISDKVMKTAEAAMQRTYPFEKEESAEKAVVVCGMDKVDDWTLVEGEDKRIYSPLDPPHLALFQPGKFTVEQAKDAEKGNYMKVTLKKEGEVNEFYREYGFVRLKKPVEVAGQPDSLGLWVKGNSSWGKIYFEIEDADGETWISAGTGGYGCEVYDWPEKMGINFDGWCFLQFPLSPKSPVKNFSPGENHWQWQSHKGGDGKITYPIKVKGVGFALARKTLNLLEMVDIKDLSIGLKDFSAF